MNKQTFVLTICFAVLVASSVLILGHTSRKTGTAQAHKVAQQPTEELPEHIPYMFFFDHHHFNLKKAAELRSKGKDGSRYQLMFKQKAGLSDEQAEALDQITLDYAQELEQQDAKAQIVINEFQARYPPGKLPPGVTLPPPPPELAIMQEERNAIILRARDRWRRALGEQESVRFDNFIKTLGVYKMRPDGEAK